MIKGISDNTYLPRLGCIRLGVKVKGKTGKTYPREVDYFILDPATPDEEERKMLISKFHELYGDKPKSLPIMLPSKNMETTFPQNYKRYGTSTTPKCVGDGEVAECLHDDFAKGLKPIGGRSNKGHLLVGCAGRDCIYVKKRECGIVGVLKVLLPDLPGIGAWQIATGSYHSIVSVNGGIRQLIHACGSAHMIPLTLRRVPKETNHDHKTKVTHYILDLNSTLTMSALQKLAHDAPAGFDYIPTDEHRDTDKDVPDSDLTEMSPDEMEKLKETPEPAKKAERPEEVKPEEPAAEPSFFEFMNQIRGALGDKAYQEVLDHFSLKYLSDIKNQQDPEQLKSAIKQHIQELLNKKT